MTSQNQGGRPAPGARASLCGPTTEHAVKRARLVPAYGGAVLRSVPILDGADDGPLFAHVAKEVQAVFLASRGGRLADVPGWPVLAQAILDVEAAGLPIHGGALVHEEGCALRASGCDCSPTAVVISGNASDQALQALHAKATAFVTSLQGIEFQADDGAMVSFAEALTTACQEAETVLGEAEGPAVFLLEVTA